MNRSERVSIRDFQPRYAERWAAIFHAAVHGPATSAYDAAQRCAWSPSPASRGALLEHVRERQVWTAVDANDLALAFIELEPDGHIDCFYCHPDASGAGLGQRLYDTLEREARHRGLQRLFVEASEAAKQFFLKQGFHDLGRQDLTRNGVSLHNHRMEKTLG